MKRIILKYAFVILAFILPTAKPLYSETFRISSITEYTSLEANLNQGDTLIWKNGTYQDVTWDIRHNSLTVLAEIPGKVIFNGKSVTRISADSITFSGFQFLDGTTADDVVKVSGSHNRITNLNISEYHSHYYFHITTSGKHNLVENCNFENKPPAPPGKEGTSIFQVAVDSVSPGYNIIRYCSFRNHQAPPNSGGDYGMEALRIGYSFQSRFISRTLVEYCFFTRCYGDGEIISNKARENIFRYNSFTGNGDSHLTLRHGSDNVVYGNFFLDGAGIRIKEGQNQMVYNNYFSTGSFFSIRLENYKVDPLRNIVIVYNTFVHSGPLKLGGKGPFQPENVLLCNNFFVDPDGEMANDPTGKEQFINNPVHSGLSQVPTGFYAIQNKIESNKHGYIQPSAKIKVGNGSKSIFKILDIPEWNDDPEIILDISGNRRTGKTRSAGCFEPGKKTKPVNLYATVENTGPGYLHNKPMDNH